MKRWRPVFKATEVGDMPGMKETKAKDGYVFGPDHDRVVREKDAEIARLEHMLESYRIGTPLFGAIAERDAELARLRSENEKLTHAIKQELFNNDEFGCEFVYITIAKQENARLRASESKLVEIIRCCKGRYEGLLRGHDGFFLEAGIVQCEEALAEHEKSKQKEGT